MCLEYCGACINGLPGACRKASQAHWQHQGWTRALSGHIASGHSAIAVGIIIS